MTARDRLHRVASSDMPVSIDEVNEAIDAFARELAEQQRATGRDNYCSGIDCCQEHGGVADLIDPKAQRANTEGDTP